MLQDVHRLSPVVLTLVVSAAAASAASCGKSDGGASADDAGAEVDAAADVAAPDASTLGPDQARQTGTIQEALSNDNLPGATVTVAGRATTTAADGTYALVVPRNQPMTMIVSSDAHYTLQEQEWIVKTPALARIVEDVITTSVANLIATLLPGVDETKGILAVHVEPVGACTSEGGTVVALSPPGNAKVAYMLNGAPSATATSVQAGQSFSALFYNVDPGVTVTVTATSPTCTPKPFPVDEDGVTYTGNQTTTGGPQLSYFRVFLDAPLKDAGAD